ncbi:hypothetical protein AB1Y20_006585 [Prymnesium parvum]|uniref:trimethyllysine dioxygenase n=1 Tax=Prymnesium parvum TaxID=97485 RepID=A0AB34J275_PRYPA
MATQRWATRSLSLVGRRMQSTASRMAPGQSFAPQAAPLVRMRSAAILSQTVQLTWEDETIAHFHHTWLRDHCPQSVHPVSHQREIALSSIRPGIVPSGVSVDDGQSLLVKWHASVDPTGADHQSVFDGEWLRRHAYSSEGSARVVDEEDALVVQWGAGGRALPEPIDWASLACGGSDAESALLQLLSSVHAYGVGRVSGMPLTMEATEQLARMIAPVHETFYGGMWDTAPREESQVIDTAYTNVELPLHTDGTYFEQQPGLQLFNCVAQPPPAGGLDGSTRLADGFALAAKLAAEAPKTFEFFSRVVLPFEHREGAVHMRCLGQVFKLHPLTRKVVEVRWNETDRGPINTLSFDDMGQFYDHVRKLQAAIDSLELKLQLKPGDALICNNHRVMHGRRGFVGHRRLLGCYLQADDWRSRWRVLRGRQ